MSPSASATRSRAQRKPPDSCENAILCRLAPRYNSTSSVTFGDSSLYAREPMHGAPMSRGSFTVLPASSGRDTRDYRIRRCRQTPLKSLYAREPSTTYCAVLRSHRHTENTERTRARACRSSYARHRHRLQAAFHSPSRAHAAHLHAHGQSCNQLS